jgi:hypothetical protein
MNPELQPARDRTAEVLRLLHPEDGDAYVILDAARAGRVLRVLEGTRVERVVLYEGPIDPRIAAVAPWLVLLPRSSGDTRRVVEAAWGNAWGVFLSTRTEMDSLRRHLRRFLSVLTERRKKLLFRYYDPRVLRPYLPSCTESELQTFLGPIDQYVIEGEEPDVAIVHTRAGARTVRLEA